MKRYTAEILIGCIVMVFALRLDLFAFLRAAVRKWLHSVPETKQEKPTLLSCLSVSVLFILFAFLLFYKAEEIPVPYHADEAGMAYDALSLANFGVDRFLYKNPVYFINFGGGASALYTYLAVLAVRVFGYSVLSVRLPAIILSLLSALFFVCIIQREYGSVASVFAMGSFCGLPFSIMHSRWGLDCYLFFPTMIISVCCFYAAVKTKKIRWFLLAGVSFGITLYSYAISYVFIPLFLGAVCLYLLFIRQIKWSGITALLIPIILTAVPLLLLMAVNYGLIEEIHTPFLSVPKLPIFRSDDIGFEKVISNLRPNKMNIFYRIFVYDFNPSNVIIRFGTCYYFTLPIIFWGFLLCVRRSIRQIRNKQASLDMLMVWLFISALAVSLTLDGVNVNRACEIYIPVIYFLCAGIVALYQQRKAAALIGCAVFAVLSASFLHYYFFEFPGEMADIGILNSVDDLRDALNFADGIDHEKQITIINGDRPQPYIYTLLALDIDPYTFSERKNQIGNWVLDFDKYHFRNNFFPEEMSSDSVYVFMEMKEIPEDMETYGLEYETFHGIRVYYEPAENNS